MPAGSPTVHPYRREVVGRSIYPEAPKRVILSLRRPGELVTIRDGSTVM